MKPLQAMRRMAQTALRKLKNAWLLLLLSLVGCASNSLPSPPGSIVLVQKQVTLPALPPTSKQPAPPPECLPSCLENLISARESMRASLAGLMTPDSAANATTPPAAPR